MQENKTNTMLVVNHKRIGFVVVIEGFFILGIYSDKQNESVKPLKKDFVWYLFQDFL